jgi:hypothetical protein
MSKHLAVVMVVLTMLLTGCATGPATGSLFREQSPDAGKGQIYIYRPDSPPTKRAPRVLVDGRHVANLLNAGFVRIPVEPGPHTLSVDWAGDTGVSDTTIRLSVAAGETVFVRHVSKHGLFKFPTECKVVPHSYAVYELQDLREVGLNAPE